MDLFLGFLADMPFWVWFVLAAALLVLELSTGTTMLLWPAASAAIMGVITTVQLGGQWVTQWTLFAVLTVVLGLVGRPYARRWITQSATDKPGLNDPAARREGRVGTVASDFVAGRGRVRLGDTEWQARSDDEASLTAGASVEVTGMDGTVLIVAPVR